MIVFDHVSKGYRAKSGNINWVLQDFSYIFRDGVNVGILALKGAGKTTLVNLMAGVDIPTSGRIARTRSVSWPFGYRGNLSNRLTAKQNIRFIAGIYGRDFNEMCDFIGDFSELGNALDQPMGRYSFEMRMKLIAAMYFSIDFKHLLFDELGGFGDAKLRRKCFDTIAALGDRQNAIILTANPEYLHRYCQVGGVLDNGKLEIYDSVEAAIDAFKSLRQPVEAEI